ncbi:inhibitor-3 [Abeliophyllum distichum]|uniref:Inhibitor-3 n=1 Tax=Abeliophyllum distichum TaxID=126358 RepID=A0ABD1UMQ4_9LAMI
MIKFHHSTSESHIKTIGALHFFHRATTLTLETANSPNQQQQSIMETLVLKLKPPRKKVSWKEATVDTEFMNKKSSKKCCIFHKEKLFDENDLDEDDDDKHDDDDGIFLPWP